MPQDLDFVLYFNIAFFSILGLGMLFGFLKGLKKSIWSFFVTLIFFAVFFLTITQVVNLLWTINMPFLGGVLANVSPALSSASSLQEALPLLLEQFLPAELQSTLTNEHFLELVTSISLFVVKLVYTILYFTVIQLLYRIIFWILRMIIFPSKKKTDKYKSKNRGLGAVFGLLSGVMSLYVTLIMFGGLISISESLLNVFPAPDAQTMSYVELGNDFDRPTDSIIELAESTSPFDDPMITDAYNMLNDMVSAYNDNIVVQTQNQITLPSEYDQEEMPMNLYLFDAVLSMDYQDEQVAFRREIEIYTEVAGAILNSDFMDTMDVADLSGNDIRDAFTALSQSNLITSIIPIAVEVGADFVDTEISIPTDELYEIDWELELTQLGNIAATTFDLISAAGILNGTVDINTVQLDGDAVEEIFVALGQSQLVNLAAYVAIEPILEMAGSEISAVITVPDDIDWGDEFAAIGALANEILSTNITVGEITEADPAVLLDKLSQIDFEVLLDSKIITNAMINILSGNTFIDVSFLSLPSNIGDWDADDWNTELTNILAAVNALATLSATIDIGDFENLSFDLIAGLDLEAINAIFESRILVATITNYLMNLDLGSDFVIVIPDMAFDEDGYLLKTELQDVVTAASIIVDELVCPVGEDCGELGFNIAGILTLEGDDITTVLNSNILWATIGTLLMDMGADILTVPGSALTQIDVDSVSTDVVTKEEIVNAFVAITALGITDINDIQVDTSILKNLAQPAPNDTLLDQDKADKLFSSSILNATLSSFLFDFTEGPDSIVVVPYFDQLGDSIRVIDPVDGTQSISIGELTNILEAILALDIDDISSLETFDIGLILSNVDTLLESSILHATVSKMMLDMDDVISVPYQTVEDVTPRQIKITVGTGLEQTTYIAKFELQAAFDALEVLDITDINSISMDITILKNLAQEAPNDDLLDTDKSDILFGSAIINATMSKFLLDFTDVAPGEDPLVIVPELDQDGNAVILTEPIEGLDIISVSELTNVLKAVLSLRLDNFEDFETIDLDLIMSNVSTLLDSAILHATVSKQLLDLTDVIVVPYQTVEDVVPVPIKITQGDVTYISKDELENTFDALQVLGITDINSVAIDITILKNLAQEAPNDDELDTDKSDVLFGSAIINATMSKFLLDFTDVAPGEDPLVIVPDVDQDGNTIILIEPTEGTEILAVSELTNVLKAVLSLRLDSFEDFETIDLGVIMDNVSTLLDSAILHATVSKQLLDLTDVIVVPYQTVEDVVPVQIKITQGDVVFISKTELQSTFDALEVLGITDINSVAMDITILKNLAQDEPNDNLLDQGKADILFGSTIINATMSKFLLDFTNVAEGEDPLVIVPDVDQDGGAIVLTEPVEGTEILAVAELTNVLEAVLALRINDFNEFETIELSTIMDNVATLLDSSILHATVSKQLLDLTDVIVVPYQTVEDVVPVPIKITQGTVTYIEKTELQNTFDALQVLGITDINSVAMDITILKNLAQEAPNDDLLDDDKADTLFSSVIIKATMSKFLLDFTNVAEGEDPLVIVPEFDQDNNAIVLTEPTEGTEIISKTELTNVLKAVLALRLDDFNEFESLGLDTIISNAATLLDSSILHATVSDQLLQLTDVIIVPYQTVEEVVPVQIKITRGDVTFIERNELLDTFDALEVLGITDINSVAMDISILKNLAQDAPNDNLLDTGKSTILFDSVIIKATMSKFLLDFTQVDPGQDPLIIVPDVDQDNNGIVLTEPEEGIDIIVELELTNILKAVLALGLDDFNQFETLGLDTIISNAPTLLDSAILHATVSDQLLQLDDVIVVPYQTVEDVVPVQIKITRGTVTFIERQELLDTFDALEVLEMTDLNSVSIDIGILKRLAQEAPNDNLLDETKSAILFDSVIIKATMSKFLLDFTQVDPGQDPLIIVPEFDQNNNGIILTEVTESLEIIVEAELTNVLKAVLALGLDDFNEFETLGLDTIISNASTLLDSAILHATISDQLLALDDVVVVPYQTIEDVVPVPIKITRGTVTYIERQELLDTFDALDVLGISDINSVSIDASILLTLEDDLNPGQLDTAKSAILFDSVTIKATISKFLLDFTSDPDPFVIVPYDDYDLVDIRLTEPTEGVEIVVEAELTNILKAIIALGITDFNAFETITLTDLNNNITTLLDSAILHATISKQMIDMDDGSTIIIPYESELKYTNALAEPIRKTVTGVEFVNKDELEATFAVLPLFGITNFQDFSTDGDQFTIGNFNDNIDDLLLSSMLHAVISKQILDQADGGSIIVPYRKENNTDPVRISVQTDDTLHTNHYIESVEIKAIINMLDKLGLDDVSEFSGSVSLTNLSEPGFKDAILASSIVQANISDQLFTSEDGDTFIIPDEDELFTPVVIETGPVGNETTYVSNQEISDLLDALEALDIDDVTGFDSSTVNFQTFSTGGNAEIVSESVIIQAIISKQLIDVDNDPLIDFIIPYQASDNSDIRVTVDDGVGTIELVVKQEIVDVIYAMKLLGVTNPSEFTGGVSLGVFFRSTYLDPQDAVDNQNTLLASAIMHATVSQQITNLSGIIVPASDMQATSIHFTTDTSADEFIIKDEIKALFDSLDAIGLSGAADLSSFDGSISLSGIANNDTKQTTMLASAIMHATISDKLTGLSDDFLIVPAFSAGNDGNETYRIYKVVLTYDFIDKQEIKYIIDGFDLLGLGGFEMSSAINAQDFFTYQDELLLSSSIHATLSNRLFEINTNPLDPIIIYPEFDIRQDPDEDILLLHNDGITFIEMDELLLFMDALDEMGLTNFGNITGISPTQIVGTKAEPKDLSVITASAIMQATASDKILDGATDYASATNGGLIIANYHREDITVGVATEEWIEQAELILFLEAVRIAGITDFGASIGGDSFNTLSDAEIGDIMNSASMYLTIENMIKSNTQLNSYIPTVAVEAGAVYDLNGLIENSEVEEFVLAIKALDGDLSGDVNITALQGVNETQRNIALQSDIIRCRVTPDLVNIMQFIKFDPYDGTDYESYGPDLVLYTSALEAFN